MPSLLAQKKVREARFFLGELRKRDEISRLDLEEEFGFQVSAFLSASSSVQSVLSVENPGTFKPHRNAWLASMDDDLRLIVNFMFDRRRLTVHQGKGSARQLVEHVHVLKEKVKEGRAHGARVIQPWAYDNGATIGIATYVLAIDGHQLPAVATCDRYLAALEDLIARCEG